MKPILMTISPQRNLYRVRANEVIKTSGEKLTCWAWRREESGQKGLEKNITFFFLPDQLLLPQYFSRQSFFFLWNDEENSHFMFSYLRRVSSRRRRCFFPLHGTHAVDPFLCVCVLRWWVQHINLFRPQRFRTNTSTAGLISEAYAVEREARAREWCGMKNAERYNQ